MGRDRSGSPPSITVVEFTNAATAVRKREDVPASCASMMPGNTTERDPFTTQVSPAPAIRPTCDNASIMTAVSSPSGIPVTVDVPSARNAHTNARFATLLEPGTRTIAFNGPGGATMRASELIALILHVEVICRCRNRSRKFSHFVQSK